MDVTKLVGHDVTHGLWGLGHIIGAEGQYVSVEFTEKGLKKIQFPKAFTCFLLIDDENMQKEIEEEAEKQSKKLTKQSPKIEVKEAYKKSFIEMGDSFATHAEALNECFGFNYSHFQQAYKVINDEYAVWFPNIAKQVFGEYVSTDHTSGWVNILSDAGKTLVQVDKSPQEPQEQTEKFKKNRIVFAKFAGDERYQFIGVFDYGVRIDNGYKSTRIGTKFDTIKMLVLEK